MALTSPLEAIRVTPLKRIAVEGGDVLHAMRRDEVGYIGFGEAYFSMVERGATKAWKRHRRMTLNLVVPVGSVCFVFRGFGGEAPDAETRSEVIGESRYARLTVPPGIWFGFTGLASPVSLVLNIADVPHDPEEVERAAIGDFPYDWTRAKTLDV